jgi:hypothetical protein
MGRFTDNIGFPGQAPEAKAILLEPYRLMLR